MVQNPMPMIQALQMRKFTDCGGYWQGCCPVHGGDNRRAFMLYKNTMNWTCNTHACHGRNDSASMFILVMKVRKCSFKESVEFVKAVYGVGEVDVRLLDKLTFEDACTRLLPPSKREERYETYPIELVETFRQWKHPYYLARGFDQRTLDWFEVGFHPADLQVDELGDQNFSDRMMIPIHDERAELVGFAGRTIHDELVNTDLPKFRFTKGLPKNRVIYNYHRARNHIVGGELILVESPGVTWSFFEAGFLNVGAVLGANLSNTQMRILEKTKGLHTITVAFDYGDKEKKGKRAGVIGTENACQKLHGKFRTYYIPLPEGVDYDDLSPTEIERCLRSRQLYTESRKGLVQV